MNELLAKILEKKAAAAGGVLVVTLLIAGGLFWYRGTGTPPAADEDWQNFASSDTTLETTDSFSGVAIKKYADIKGAVKHPGVYEVMTGERVIDLIEKAGGVTAEAATNQVNFAQLVEDQAVIFVPKEGEEPQLAAVSQAQETAANQAQINVNTADATQLQQLSGIGAKKAQDIIAYRESNGSFQTIDELKNVSGIGEKTFEKLAPYIKTK